MDKFNQILAREEIRDKQTKDQAKKRLIKEELDR
jgi:hypothetical protein